MKEVVLYYRRSLMDEVELTTARKYFKCVDLLTDIPDDSFVIGRFSLYPFYYDQIRELKNKNCQLINEHWQYEYIADLQNYVADLAELTPRTWDRLDVLPENTQFVLKGETNSRKNAWKTSMFAANKHEAMNVYSRLVEDSLIGSQKIYIREYVPLHTYMIGIGGMPVTKEYRFFVAYGTVISSGFYWQNYVDDLSSQPDVSEVPQTFIQEVINKVGQSSNFYVIDVAQTKNGNWIVVELNEGQFSGLSCNDPGVMYENLQNQIKMNI